MKVKFFPNPVFDFAMGYLGGFDDIPTKQDQFKPIEYTGLHYYDERGNIMEVSEKIYIINEKGRANRKKFEENLINQIKENIKETHPYRRPTQLEVKIGINGTTKRLKEVDIDNLAKCVLDCFNGLIYEDDSQIVSLLASKTVIEHDWIPELSGLMIGIRVLSEEKKILNNTPIFLWEPIEENEDN